ncbi:MAG: CbtB-domain containing protein [Gammaproteobacteria bacterium]|nr:CbtB-domain containing protein [Gammaproteobacteria bacterium]
MASQTVIIPSIKHASLSRLRSSLFMLVSGSVLLYVVGFSPMSVLHNAAHDTRHAAVFPCH